MNHLLFHIFAFFCRLLREVVHFVRFGRTVSMPSARPETCPVPSSTPQNTPQRDPMAELALLKAENRVTMREANALRRKMNERRRLEREAARARGELPPAKLPPKPRRPRAPKPKSPSDALPATALATALAAALIERPVEKPEPKRPRFPIRMLLSRVARLLTAPLRIVKPLLLALPRLLRCSFLRRPAASDSPRAGGQSCVQRTSDASHNRAA